ncbi:uncharacterized protein BXZ73DRAFT_82125 [Epithele typhae]|uniref:uncharacterized protein n=1 Tax=Epithele typhae TaxID=378194 RepID=UPI002008AAB3|nr:uncharacterized protein BXZ73DRAFT_82125 [Epithele typhae]KAH9912863.1 hypothetical protein BXZ73DRAFT_82125 [Epithele typhae]
MTLTWRTSTFRTTLTCERELVKCTGEMWYRTAGSFGHRNLARPTPSAWSVLVRPVRMGIPRCPDRPAKYTHAPVVAMCASAPSRVPGGSVNPALLSNDVRGEHLCQTCYSMHSLSNSILSAKSGLFKLSHWQPVGIQHVIEAAQQCRFRARQAGRPERRRARLDSPLNPRGPTPNPLSAKLSQLAAFALREPTIKPRRIAILVVDDFNPARVDGTSTALKAEMVTMWIVGPCWRPAGDGRSKPAYSADHHYGDQRSALFNAIVVASSAANARTGHWARATWAHVRACAPITGLNPRPSSSPKCDVPLTLAHDHVSRRDVVALTAATLRPRFHLHEANTTPLSLHFRICGLDTSHDVWFATGLGPDLLLIARPDMMSISHDYGVFIEDEGMIALRGLFLIDSMKVSSAITINNLPINRSVEETIRLVKAFQFTQWMRLSSSAFPVAAPADLSFSLTPPSPPPFATQPQEEHGEE